MRELPVRRAVWSIVTSRKKTTGSALGEVYESSWWSVVLPPGWTASRENECTTFRATPPLGALQISSARKDLQPVDDNDLKEFAREHSNSAATLCDVKYGSFVGFSAERSQAGLYWKEWWLRSGRLMLYVTYNVAVPYKDSEMSLVEGILRTATAR